MWPVRKRPKPYSPNLWTPVTYLAATLHKNIVRRPRGNGHIWRSCSRTWCTALLTIACPLTPASSFVPMLCYPSCQVPASSASSRHPPPSGTYAAPYPHVTVSGSSRQPAPLGSHHRHFSYLLGSEEDFFCKFLFLLFLSLNDFVQFLQSS